MQCLHSYYSFLISNLKIQNKTSKGKNAELAFINTLNENAEIKNVTFDNYTVEGNSGIKKAAGLIVNNHGTILGVYICILYTSPRPRDLSTYRMPYSA